MQLRKTVPRDDDVECLFSDPLGVPFSLPSIRKHGCKMMSLLNETVTQGAVHRNLGSLVTQPQGIWAKGKENGQ